MAHWALVIYFAGVGVSPSVGVVPGFDNPMLCQLAAGHLPAKDIPVKRWSCVQTDGSTLVPLPFKDGEP